MTRQLDNHITSKNLHFYLQQDRNGILSNLRIHFNISDEVERLHNYTNSSSCTSEINDSDDEFTFENNMMVRLSPVEWLKIKPKADEQ